jgi:hypothetical protein
MALFGLAGAAAFLTWPVWVGPLALVAVAVALFNRERPFRQRAFHLGLAGLPIAFVAAMYVGGRGDGLAMAATGGAAPWPEASNYGRPLLWLSAAGFVVSVTHRQARTTALLAASIGLQSMALYVLATRSAADAPYLALKMLYLLLYPQAVAAALVLAIVSTVIFRAFERAARPIPEPSPRGRHWSRVATMSAWLLVAWIGSIILRPLGGAPRSLTVLRHPAVSAPLEIAGQWARENVPAGCVEYLVDDAATAYWLHLAVLGNPRISARSVDSRTFEPGLAIARWLTPGGLPYAVADLPALPRGVRDELDIVQQFGTAAVVRRRDESSCDAAR